MRAYRAGLAAAMAWTMLLAGTHAATAAQVYVVHGIPGQDVGAPAALPVDVCLAGGGLVGNLTGVTFGQIAGPLELPAGRYDLEVRLTGGAPCSGPLAVANTVYAALGENLTVVAHLSEQGSPALTKFVNDLRPLGADRARLVVRHGAALPAVRAAVRNPRSFELTDDVTSGTQTSALTRRAGEYRISALTGSLFHPALQLTASLDAGVAYFAYAVGSRENGTLALVVQAVSVP